MDDRQEMRFEENTERVGDCLLWTGQKKGGYGVLEVGALRVPAHRYAWERTNGPVPEGSVVDHRDHCDTLCVEVDHLRVATVPQNIANRAGANKNNRTTGVRNVQEHGRGRYRVVIWANGKRYRYGPFGSVEEASVVAEQKRAELFGEFAGKG